MGKAQLIEKTKDLIRHAEAGTMELNDNVFEVPASNYYDQERFDLEKDRIFKRLPLILAATGEMPYPGDYKAITAVGVPVLISRDADGEVHAFMNSCTHRGAQIMDEGHGNANRFMCPYHGWTFGQKGELAGIAIEEEFGTIDKSCYGLRELPALERAGLIWVILNPNSTLDMEAFLCGYDEMLGNFGFDTWHFYDSRVLRGPNWKIAYDGYMDLYHLPVLHKNTIGAGFSPQANFYGWGPHQHLTGPGASLHLKDMPEEEWPVNHMLMGVWTVFPHVSIASFDGGGRGVMISQLFPGEHPGESFTTQLYLMENAPSEEQEKLAHDQFALLEVVVRDEDYATGLKQQRALEAGARDHVLFGRNEGGGQIFHGWVDKILATEDEDLNDLFKGK